MLGSSNGQVEQCIEILNLNESDVIKHPILLLKGRLLGKHNKQSKLIIDFPEKKSIEYLVTPISQRGVFKLLLNLNELFLDDTLENSSLQLSLQHGAAKNTVNIKYATTAQRQFYKVQPLYVLCADHGITAEVQQQQKAIIDLNLQLVQSVYADRLRAAELGGQTFQINGKCSNFEISLKKSELWQLTGQEIWQHVASSILNSTLYQQETNLKFVAFIACTKYAGEKVEERSYAQIRQNLFGHVALGAGGLALFSVAYFYAWAQRFSEILQCFENAQAVDYKCLPDESNFRRTYGGVYASTLGAVCHELGHIFDLGHTLEGVMGSGFDYLNRLFTVDTRTEALPQRQIQFVAKQTTTTKTRLTKLKPQNCHVFLDKYRAQQIADEEEFYFTRNCALMLAYHKWLRHTVQATNEQLLSDNCIYLNELEIKCCFPIKLKLIEVRKNENAFVLWFHEFKTHEFTESFVLPSAAGFKSNETHLIILTCCGAIKRIYATNQI